MRTISFYSLVALISCLYLVISWVDYRFLCRKMSIFSNRFVRTGYWMLTSVTFCLIVYYWVIEPSANFMYVHGFYLALYIAFNWCFSQLAIILTIPFFYGCQYFMQLFAQPAEQAADNTPEMSRRIFLRKMASITPVFAFGVGTQGVFIGDTEIVVRRHQLTFSGLPAAWNGLKLAQLSDTHIGPFFNLDKLDYVAGMIRREKPDLLAITGDLIDDLDMLDETFARLEQLSLDLRHGIYYCWGNHEHYKNMGKIRERIAKSTVTLIENTHYRLMAGEQPVYIVGVDYPWANNAAERKEKRRQYIAAAHRGIPHGSFTILLAHHPDFIDDGFQRNISLTLTGHTHGGQIGIFEKPAYPLPFAYTRGMYRQKDNYGYVSVGAGHCLPFRLGCPAEIAVFHLGSFT
ncbi:MAG TPA: metallophosphoesterase [Methylomusa anaerophila]|uniref:Putative metallophosphoesterase n=1 Tax=Methylomusa anaerophila TaxID=1930071 RepID=A0A348ALA6_9FIRM|nr:metallophosphoesterase [Methylomusa anaerophila]BBB91854.1 putative metallophosphoesterase [Methylomusa anaerophila]HML88414.1 metallophosphoesterase [Methylomusa anaerophila]